MTFVGNKGKRKLILECEAKTGLKVVHPVKDLEAKGQHKKKGNLLEGK